MNGLPEDRVLLAVAAAAAIAGAAALVTGSGLVAAISGLASIVTAALAVRASGRHDSDDASGAELDERPEPTDEDFHIAVAARSTVGMLDEESLPQALLSRTAVARRALRPLSVVHLEVVEVGEHGERIGPRDLVAEILDTTLRESDLCGRRNDGVYVFILEDTGEDGAVWTAERLRRRVTGSPGERRYCAGIASYPNHALDADELDAKAAAALAAAREWHRDRIEVATSA